MHSDIFLYGKVKYCLRKMIQILRTTSDDVVLFLYFRRKYIIGEAYFIRRMAYITDLRSKSISLWVAHIPMRNPLSGVFFISEHQTFQP